MTGNDNINLTLSIQQWRDVYRTLNRDRLNPDEKTPKVNPIWQSHLNAIEDVCKAKQEILTLPLAMTWPMSALVRQTMPELADEISRQMSAQAQATWSDSAEITEERFQMDIEPIESVLVKLPDSRSPNPPDKRRSRSAKSSE